MVAVIWYGEGELGARTGGLGLQQEEGKGVISRWAGSPAVCGKELAFPRVQLQAGPGLLLHACFPISSFPACALQYSAKAGLSPSAAFRGAAEARPVRHPREWIPSHPIPRRGWLLAPGHGGHPAPLFPPLCKPELAFTPGTGSLGECGVGMSRCSNCCASSCLWMLNLE